MRLNSRSGRAMHACPSRWSRQRDGVRRDYERTVRVRAALGETRMFVYLLRRRTLFGSDIRERSGEAEILDGSAVAEDVRERCYHDLARMHRWLGNHRAILECLRRDALPVETVLDIGCGHGALLQEMQTKLGVDAIGIDLNPPRRRLSVAILCADAVRDRLPVADVAVSVAMVHHLSAEELATLIRNVGRACRRFVILDLVRSRIPLALFRGFVAPFVNSINA